jgi:hypothetical protein
VEIKAEDDQLVPLGLVRKDQKLQSACNRQVESDRVSEDIAGVSVALSTYTEAFKSISDLSLVQDAAKLQAKRLPASAASLRAGLDV